MLHYLNHLRNNFLHPIWHTLPSTKKYIALKASNTHDDDEDDKDEEIAFLSRKSRRFLT